MSDRRIKRYSKRRAREARRASRMPVLLLIIAFLVFCLVVSVAIGIALGKKADIDGDERTTLQREEYISGEKTVRSVQAYDLTEGHSASDYVYQGIDDISLCIRHADGRIPFASSVAAEFGFDEITSQRSLSTTVRSAHNSGGRIWAYFYVTSFDVADENLREVYKSYELALISEAAEAGVDGILLIGVDPTESNIDEAEEFAVRASLAAGDAVLGVALSAETMLLCESEIYLAGRMKNACDHLALDLRHITYGEEIIQPEGTVSRLYAMIYRMEYYISAYSMRVLFSKENSKLHIEAEELGIIDFQIIDE